MGQYNDKKRRKLLRLLLKVSGMYFCLFLCISLHDRVFVYNVEGYWLPQYFFSLFMAKITSNIQAHATHDFNNFTTHFCLSLRACYFFLIYSSRWNCKVLPHFISYNPVSLMSHFTILILHLFNTLCEVKNKTLLKQAYGTLTQKTVSMGNKKKVNLSRFSNF